MPDHPLFSASCSDPFLGSRRCCIRELSHAARVAPATVTSALSAITSHSRSPSLKVGAGPKRSLFHISRGWIWLQPCHVFFFNGWGSRRSFFAQDHFLDWIVRLVVTAAFWEHGSRQSLGFLARAPSMLRCQKGWSLGLSSQDPNIGTVTGAQSNISRRSPLPEMPSQVSSSSPPSPRRTRPRVFSFPRTK